MIHRQCGNLLCSWKFALSIFAGICCEFEDCCFVEVCCCSRIFGTFHGSSYYVVLLVNGVRMWSLRIFVALRLSLVIFFLLGPREFLSIMLCCQSVLFIEFCIMLWLLKGSSSMLFFLGGGCSCFYFLMFNVILTMTRLMR